MKRALFTVLVGAAGLVSCAGGAYVYYAPAAPPPVRVEAFGAAPGPGYVWINGYWGYSGGGYAWVAGRWERPPHRGAKWVAGRWERKGNRWGYRAGHWG
jgi:hypothetical protein